LRVLIRVSKRTAAKIEHEYEVYFGQLLMNKARTIVACVDRQGQVQRITDDIMYGDRESK
ncbi:MAG: hypothetical protein KDA66_06610, partial [Planctomycetaceae bacterium]|nr:hypothetical protein [Planctomycetaceae bacterium]